MANKSMLMKIHLNPPKLFVTVSVLFILFSYKVFIFCIGFEGVSVVPTKVTVGICQENYLSCLYVHSRVSAIYYMLLFFCLKIFRILFYFV